MKKYIFSLILILNIANLFAYDQQVYKELLAGGKKFENADLSKAKIENMDLSDVTFANVNLTGAFFHNSMLTNVTFDSCNLSTVTYCDLVFNNSKILNNSNLTSCIFAKVIFDSSEISNSLMPNAKLLETDFMVSRLCNINMDSSEWDTVNFSGCTLENINFRAAKLDLVKIYETVQIGNGLIFDQTSFSRCCLLGRNEKSSVTSANFFGTIFKNSYFLNLNFDN
ncbi:MAG: pentapeptide repeat-containing protein [Candidatus Babeliales bacterium]